MIREVFETEESPEFSMGSFMRLFCFLDGKKCDREIKLDPKYKDDAIRMFNIWLESQSNVLRSYAREDVIGFVRKENVIYIAKALSSDFDDYKFEFKDGFNSYKTASIIVDYLLS